MSGKSSFTAVLVHALLFTLAVGYVLPVVDGFSESSRIGGAVGPDGCKPGVGEIWCASKGKCIIPRMGDTCPELGSRKPTRPKPKPNKLTPYSPLACKNNEFITPAVYDNTKRVCNPCPDGYTCNGIHKKPCKYGYTCTEGKSNKIPRGVRTGGIHNSDTTSQGATRAAMKVLTEFDKTNRSPYISGLLRVTKYSTQVVAGVTSYVELEWGPSTCLKSNTPTRFFTRLPTECPPNSRAGTITGRVYSRGWMAADQVTVTSS
jgi:hypothetical protein